MLAPLNYLALIIRFLGFMKKFSSGRICIPLISRGGGGGGVHYLRGDGWCPFNR